MLDNPLIRAIILGIIQGVTEFLPVSSDGHLLAIPYLLSWEPPALSFIVALHLGTLVAVVGYFWGDVWYLATRSFGIGVRVEGEAARARRTVALLAVGTLPAAIIGLTLQETFEQIFQNPLGVVFFFLVTAGFLWSAEVIRRRRARALGITDPGPLDDPGRDETTVGWFDSIFIGVLQATALLPGVSRSGSTIAAGMYRGLSREAAARFSFLLMIPAVAGATILELPQAFSGDSPYTTGQTIAGIVAAGVSGYWAVRYLLRLVSRDSLTGFARYLVMFSALLAIGYAWIGPVSEV